MIIGKYIKYCCQYCSTANTQRSNRCTHVADLLINSRGGEFACSTRTGATLVLVALDPSQQSQQKRHFISNHSNLRIRLKECVLSKDNPYCHTKKQFAFQCSESCTDAVHDQGPILNVFVKQEKFEIVEFVQASTDSPQTNTMCFPFDGIPVNSPDYMAVFNLLLPDSAHDMSAVGISYQYGVLPPTASCDVVATKYAMSLAAAYRQTFNSDNLVSPFYSIDPTINPLGDGSDTGTMTNLQLMFQHLVTADIKVTLYCDGNERQQGTGVLHFYNKDRLMFVKQHMEGLCFCSEFHQHNLNGDMFDESFSRSLYQMEITNEQDSVRSTDFRPPIGQIQYVHEVTTAQETKLAHDYPPHSVDEQMGAELDQTVIVADQQNIKPVHEIKLEDASLFNTLHVQSTESLVQAVPCNDKVTLGSMNGSTNKRGFDELEESDNEHSLFNKQEDPNVRKRTIRQRLN
ncbi:hypothetical protein WICPIJ_007199 [Wickerhamomyces pijperi]|uniref:Uncharacterized protein n=1 Tax=Wickerhamomyces pijperi TaxID=599730 RepID=A0A9P8Q2W3_WICPI|nr:hypothetical protein WICPIJ_007199 [Wickerhamomyces pijperi]